MVWQSISVLLLVVILLLFLLFIIIISSSSSSIIFDSVLMIVIGKVWIECGSIRWISWTFSRRHFAWWLSWDGRRRWESFE